MSFYHYLTKTSVKDIFYNLVYKTGKLTDQIRLIYKLLTKGDLLDRDYYVLSRSVGRLINIIL